MFQCYFIETEIQSTYWKLIFYTLVAIFCFNSYIFHITKTHSAKFKAVPLNRSEAPFLVDTEGCRLYDLNPLDPRLVYVFNSTEKQICNQSVILVQNGYLKHNKGNPESEKYSCCFSTIQREEKDELNSSNYDENADWLISYSEECIDIPTSKEGVEMGAEFVEVRCHSNLSDIAPIVEHHFTVLPPSEQSVITKKKMEHWRNKTGPLPYNVLILGIDSISRLKMIRRLPETRKFLERNDFVEMKGYTKIGENTFPNVMGALTGMLPTQWQPEYQYPCSMGGKEKLDGCPFIWKKFSEHNYVTGLLEDSPGLATFNYYKTGFVQQPVDYYFRPFAVAYSTKKVGHGHYGCTGGYTQTELLAKYVEEFFLRMGEGKVPYFLHSWLTSLTHDNSLELKAYDKFFEEFLTKIIHNSSFLGNNTIILFMSDHGYRYGMHRASLVGYYEDSLPFFFIRLPPSLKSSHPEWYKNLRTNSRRLTSPLDLHASYEDIVSLADRQGKRSFTHGNWNPRNRNVFSFFEETPLNRTCASAGIKQIFCRCGLFRDKATASSLKAKLLAEAVVESLNRILVTQIQKGVCMKLRLKSVMYLRELEPGEVINERGRKVTYRDYVVGFKADPAEPEFEAMLRHFSNRTLSASSIINRINSYRGQSDCVQDQILKNYCICKNYYKTLSHD